jgi:hypothetical protein
MRTRVNILPRLWPYSRLTTERFMAVAIVLNYWAIYLMQRQITVKRSLLTRNTEVRKKDWRELSAQERNKVNKPTL